MSRKESARPEERSPTVSMPSGLRKHMKLSAHTRPLKQVASAPRTGFTADQEKNLQAYGRTLNLDDAGRLLVVLERSGMIMSLNWNRTIGTE